MKDNKQGPKTILTNQECIRDILLDKRLTLSIAESVTCGMLQASFSQVEFTSQFFQGGITTYNLGQKTRLLKIDPIHGEAENCVSRLVAQQMAVGANELFLSDVSISITGYASPLPEKGIERLFAYFSVCLKDRILVTKKITCGFMDPHLVQKHYCETALRSALHVLKKTKL